MTSAEPFTRIKIRVAAALFNGEEIALARRHRWRRPPHLEPLQGHG
ncbi:hypothetical protein [Streptomyces sp. NPDC001851]